MESEKNEAMLSRLLCDINRTQTEMIKNLRNLIIMLIVSFTVLFSSFIFGFFWYEAQYEVVEETTLSQDIDTGDGNAVINGIGDLNYGSD